MWGQDPGRSPLPAGGSKGTEPVSDARWGQGLGGPRGNRNGNFKHGLNTRENQLIRRVMREKVREIKALVQAANPRTIGD